MIGDTVPTRLLVAEEEADGQKSRRMYWHAAKAPCVLLLEGVEG
jgi:hypothetical protein